MDLDFVSAHENTKKDLGQYPASLTSRLANNAYIMLSDSKMHFALSTYHYKLITVHSLIFAVVNQIISLMEPKKSIYVLEMFDLHVSLSIWHLERIYAFNILLTLFDTSVDFQLFLKLNCGSHRFYVNLLP